MKPHGSVMRWPRWMCISSSLCKNFEECLTIRKRTARPFILDENIDGLQSLLRAYGDGAMDVINIKISKVGGLTKSAANP